MPVTSIREQVMANTLSLLFSALSQEDGNGTFKLMERDWPVGQSVPPTNRPALFLVELGERPVPGQTEEIAVERLFFGTIILDSARTFGTRSTGLNALDSSVRDIIENESTAPGGLIMRAGRDEPEANQTLPQGSTMPMYYVDYAINRGDPYTSAG